MNTFARKLSMNSFMGKLTTFSRKYPLVRGMASYAVIWPASSLCQQTISGKEHYDYMQMLRYGLFGTLFVAPTLHTWMKLAAEMWPSMSVKSALAKAVVEQFSYGPAACICFFFGMSLLEGKSTKEAAFEVQTKFVPTYKRERESITAGPKFPPHKENACSDSSSLKYSIVS